MDYGFYQSAYGGTLIPPELFNRLIFKAQTYLSNITRGRNIPDEYKAQASYALCEMAECYFNNGDGLPVKSESTDGYSVTYADLSLDRRLYSIASLYLGESGLLYKGEG